MKYWEINAAINEEMRLDPGLVTDAERVRFMNDALEEVAALHLVELTTTQAAVVAQYPTVPTGLEKLRNLYWDNVRLLPLASDKDSTSTGVPVGYILEAGAIRLFPNPTAAGSLRWTYTGTPTLCTAADILITATTVPGIPTSWHSLLTDYACYRSHRKNGNMLMSSAYKRDYDSKLTARIRAYVSGLNSQIVDSNRPESAGGDY